MTPQSGSPASGHPPVRRVARPEPLAQQAYERIRRELMGGPEMGSADRLVEQELAERLAMSRTPVREALHRLALMGYIEPSPVGGYVTHRFAARDVREHYELRALLEPQGAALAAQRDPEAIERALATPVIAQRDQSDLGNARFHTAVAELSGNRALARVVATIARRLASLRIHAQGNEEEQRRLAVGHDAVVEAIRSREPEAATRAMTEHLAFARDLLLERVARAGDGAEAAPGTADERRSAG